MISSLIYYAIPHQIGKVFWHGGSADRWNENYRALREEIRESVVPSIEKKKLIANLIYYAVRNTRPPMPNKFLIRYDGSAE